MGSTKGSLLRNYSRALVRILHHSGRVRAAPEKFEKAALLLRLGLPSTLIRHENAALFLRLGLPSTLIRHENAALFLRLGLPFTLIRHEDAAFRKRSSDGRNLKTPALRFSVDGKKVLTTELFESDAVSIERFSIERRKTKTKVITLANHQSHKHYGEPIKTRSNYM